MDNASLYRKYRPSTFEEVIGQENAVVALAQTAKKGTPSHAYLFTGGRGVGKTSLARIFARALGIQSEDLYELDAASNRGIDEVRELRDTLTTLPFTSPYKMYILDEAHMLTKEAANALLKSLEEPPSHVIFVLATTDPERLPQTIRSRCITLALREPTQEDLLVCIERALKGEGRVIDDSETKKYIASLGKRSYRDTLGLLQLLFSGTQERVLTKEYCALTLGFPDQEIVDQLVIAIVNGELESLTATLKKARGSSSKPTHIWQEVIALLRGCLIARVSPNDAAVSGLGHITKRLTKPVTSKLLLEALEREHLLSGFSYDQWLPIEVILLDLAERQRGS